MEWQMLDCKLEREQRRNHSWWRLPWHLSSICATLMEQSPDVLAFILFWGDEIFWAHDFSCGIIYACVRGLRALIHTCSLHFLFFALLPKEDVGKKDEEQEKRTSRGMDCRIRLFLIPQLVKLSTELWMPSQMSLLESGFTLWLLTPHRHRQKDQTITDTIEFFIISIHNSSSI